MPFRARQGGRGGGKQAAQKLVMKDTTLTLNEVPLKASAELAVTPEKISGPLKLSLDKIAQAKIGEIWPPLLAE